MKKIEVSNENIQSFLRYFDCEMNLNQKNGIVLWLSAFNYARSKWDKEICQVLLRKIKKNQLSIPERQLVLNQEGQFYDQFRHLDKALKSFHTALDYFKNDYQDQLAISLFLNIGGTLSKMGLYDESESYHIKAKSVCEKIGHDDFLCEIYHGLSDIYHTKEDYREALKYVSLAAKKEQEEKDWESFAFSLIRISYILLDLELFDEANKRIKWAEDFFSKHNDFNGLGIASECRGTYFLKTKNYSQSKKSFQFSLEQYSVLGDFLYNSSIVDYLGKIAFIEQDYHAAEILLLEALEGFKDNNDKNRELETAAYLSELYLKLGKIEKSRQYEEIISK